MKLNQYQSIKDSDKNAVYYLLYLTYILMSMATEKDRQTDNENKKLILEYYLPQLKNL